MLQSILQFHAVFYLETFMANEMECSLGEIALPMSVERQSFVAGELELGQSRLGCSGSGCQDKGQTSNLENWSMHRTHIEPVQNIICMSFLTSSLTV